MNISFPVIPAFSNVQSAKGINNLNYSFKSLQNYEKISLLNDFHALVGLES